MAIERLSAMLTQVPGREDWETPADLFAELDAEFRFTLDAAASPHNAKVPTYYTVDDDGLSQPWHGVVWCNPPYGREIPKWTAKAVAEQARGVTSVLLIPSRTDTRWWHDDVMPHAEVRFIRGRVRFVGAPYMAPFPSAIVIFRGREVTA